jgi:hypothetical protein
MSEGTRTMTDAPERTKQGGQPLYLVPAMVGVEHDGPLAPHFKLIMLTVSYWAEFLRGPDGQCAFCHGDTDAWSDPSTPIGDYFATFEWAETCPICKGAPS